MPWRGNAGQSPTYHTFPTPSCLCSRFHGNCVQSDGASGLTFFPTRSYPDLVWGRCSLPKGPSIKLVREVVRLGARGTASSLDAWMRDNFDALRKELRPYRANWETLADRLGQAGLTNAGGGKLTAATARKTWQRIRGRDGRGAREEPARPPPGVLDACEGDRYGQDATGGAERRQ